MSAHHRVTIETIGSIPYGCEVITEYDIASENRNALDNDSEWWFDNAECKIGRMPYTADLG
jgi:hypothetical protein